MTAPIATDTPDYQRGTVNPQVLLATVPANTRTATVTIPPNAENLVVMFKGYNTTFQLYCEGVATGLQYPGSEVFTTGQTAPTQTFIFDVTNVIEQEVVLVCTNTPTVPWYVYSDAGVHVVVDMSKLCNDYGQQYVIPTVPSITAGDHPPNELSRGFYNSTVNGNIVAAPGAGNRLRIFSLFMSCTTAGQYSEIKDGPGGLPLLNLSGAGNSALTLPGQGFPISTNSPLYLNVGGAGGVAAGAYYTTETA